MARSDPLALPATAPLLPHATPLPSNRTSKRSLALVLSLFAVLALLLPNTVTSLVSTSVSFASYGATSDLKGQCAQAKPFIPSKETHDISLVWKHKDEIVQWHQGVIRIPTPVQDEMGEPGVDKRWDVFQPLHECRHCLPECPDRELIERRPGRSVSARVSTSRSSCHRY